MEARTGMPVVTPKNATELNGVVTNMIEEIAENKDDSQDEEDDNK